MADNELQIVEAMDDHHHNVEAQYVEMMVPLYSYGCERKVKKALTSHLKGIYSIKIDYYQQKVTVWGICNKDGVLETVRKKRKGARFWNPEDYKAVVEDAGDPKSDLRRPESVERRRRWQKRQCQRALAKVQSLSLTWKEWNWKKVFDRSNSF